MTIEYKAIKAATMGIEGRTVTGIVTVHGHVDDGDGWSSRDRSHPGLFGDFKSGGRDRAVFLWQHRSSEPPIATIDRLFEVSAADLPAIVKQYAPDATGGVGVTRTYFETPRGNEVFMGIQAGAIREMSYSYEVTRWDFEKQDEGSRELPIRNIYAAEIFDCSDCNWGMNPVTSADGTKAQSVGAHSDLVKATVASYLARVSELSARRLKEGRVFSAANYSALKALADDLEGSIGQLRDLIAAGEPKQATDVRALYLKVQQTLATLNGVKA